MDKFVCWVCQDSHRMSLQDRLVPCTRCPSPCQDCRERLSAYCEMAQCECCCHHNTFYSCRTCNTIIAKDANNNFYCQCNSGIEDNFYTFNYQKMLDAITSGAPEEKIAVLRKIGLLDSNNKPIKIQKKGISRATNKIYLKS